MCMWSKCIFSCVALANDPIPVRDSTMGPQYIDSLREVSFEKLALYMYVCLCDVGWYLVESVGFRFRWIEKNSLQNYNFYILYPLRIVARKM